MHISIHVLYANTRVEFLTWIVPEDIRLHEISERGVTTECDDKVDDEGRGNGVAEHAVHSGKRGVPQLVYHRECILHAHHEQHIGKQTSKTDYHRVV
jgi:hypothetical protein